MHASLAEQWTMVAGSHTSIRDALLNAVNDGHLVFRVGGNTLSLGELFQEMADVELAYVESFKTFTQDFSQKAAMDSVSVETLKARFQQLDADFEAVLEQLSDADIESKTIERGFPCPPAMQLQVYVQALLIFAGKATIYLRAMGEPLPDSVQSWIG